MLKLVFSAILILGHCAKAAEMSPAGLPEVEICKTFNKIEKRLDVGLPPFVKERLAALSFNAEDLECFFMAYDVMEGKLGPLGIDQRLAIALCATEIVRVDVENRPTVLAALAKLKREEFEPDFHKALILLYEAQEPAVGDAEVKKYKELVDQLVVSIEKKGGAATTSIKDSIRRLKTAVPDMEPGLTFIAALTLHSTEEEERALELFKRWDAKLKLNSVERSVLMNFVCSVITSKDVITHILASAQQENLFKNIVSPISKGNFTLIPEGEKSLESVSATALYTYINMARFTYEPIERYFRDQKYIDRLAQIGVML